MSAEHSSHIIDVRDSVSPDEDNPENSESHYADDDRYTSPLFLLCCLLVNQIQNKFQKPKKMSS